MSPRPGGEASKVGGRFERRWTIRQLLRVLAGRLESVQVETLDELSDTAEFYASADGRQQAHQVKRQKGRSPQWTVNALDREGVLDGAAAQVRAGREFHFVSTIPSVDLHELCDGARLSDDAQAFCSGRLQQQSEDLRKQFELLKKKWGSEEHVWQILCEIYVHKPDEFDVHEINVVLAELYFEGPPAASVAVLGDIIDDTLGRTLTKPVLWEELGKRGIRPNQVRDTRTIDTLVAEATIVWKRSATRERLEPPIERTATGLLVQALTERVPVVLVSGDAGSGKTAVLSATVEALEGQGWPVLALRLDRLELAHTARQLGQQLELPVSPVAALGAAAGDQRALMVIDQLDAVSAASGRITENFDVVEELMRQARAFPNLRVVLACRTFDLENDPRLRALAVVEGNAGPRIVKVGPLSDDEVVAAVIPMGLDSRQLDQTQRSLLRSPLNLVLLRTVATGTSALKFRTSKDLFDSFWETKRRDCKQRREVRFDEVIGRLVDRMSETQQLSVPLTSLDEGDLIDDAHVLVSEHVLILDGKRLAFFHEAFFDYAFARRWTRRNQSLVEFLVDGNQELFRRAQVRQVLVHLRDEDPARAVREAKGLLTNDRIRFHIKDVVLGLFRALAQPTHEEWLLVEELQRSDFPWRDRLWLILRTGDWFDRLLEEGVLEKWLSSGEVELEGRAIEVMGAAAQERLADVTPVLRPLIDHPNFAGWFRWIARFASVEDDRAFFDLILETIRRGLWEGSAHDLWLFCHALGDAQPAWAVELIQAWFVDRPGGLQRDSTGRVEGLHEHDYGVVELIGKAAEGAPVAFVERLLPWMRLVMAATAYTEDVPRRDWHFSPRMVSDLQEVDDALLHGAVGALHAIGRSEPTRLRTLVAPIVGDEHEGARYLLYEGLRGAGSAHADWAAEIILGEPNGFECGLNGDGYWTTHELLLAVSPHMSPNYYQKLEAAILAFEPEAEKSATARRWRGSAQFTLLSGLPEERLSDQARRRLGELQRKFEQEEPAEPQGIISGWVGSPIPIDAARRMSDEQWLKAMRTHADSEGRWRIDLRGGADELGHVLFELTKEDPERFATLALKLNASLNPTYLDSTLRGLGDTQQDVDAQAVYRVLRHAAATPPEAHDRWLSWPMRRLLDEPVPEDIILLLIDRALHSPDPQAETWQKKAPSGDRYDSGDPYTSGINCARGSSAEMLGDLLTHDDGSRASLIVPHVPDLTADPSMAVRSCVAHLLTNLLRWNRGVATEGFSRLVKDAHPALLRTRTVEGLASWIGMTDPERVVPVVERMLDETEEKSRESGARLGAFIAIESENGTLLDRLVGDTDPAARRGAATVLAARLQWASDRDKVQGALVELLYDPDESVREAASHFVSLFRQEDLSSWDDLFLRLIDSPAFTASLPQLMITLESARGGIDTITRAVGERFVDAHGVEAGDITTRAAGEARSLGTLLLRAYSQSSEPENRSALLDIIDKLLLFGAYGMAEVVDAAR